MLNCAGGVRRLAVVPRLQQLRMAALGLRQLIAGAECCAASLDCSSSRAQFVTSCGVWGKRSATREHSRSFASDATRRRGAKAVLSAPLRAAAAQQPGAAHTAESGSAAVLPPLPEYCAGCGVRLQAKDPDRPGCAALPLADPSSLLHCLTSEQPQHLTTTCWHRQATSGSV